MQWYYEGSDGQVGPISEEEFQSLVNEGTIKSKTLVWNSTMTDWQEYGEVSGSTGSTGGEGSSRVSFCSECGRSFSQDDMIRYGESWVCASCKPIFVQKLKEGVNVSGMVHYAGFWIRFGAVIIDGIIMYIVNMLVTIPLGFLAVRSVSESNDPSDAFFYTILGNIINFTITVVYETFFIGKYGATLGKMACKLKVVTAEGDKITYLRSFARYFSKWVSYITLCIGFIMAAFDEEKRALHDRICSTRVIKR